MKHFHIRCLTLLFCFASWFIALPALADNAGGHTLSIEARPSIAGTFNTQGDSLQKGETIHLYAYSNSNFTFREWQDAQGNIIAQTPDFVYTMPDNDVRLTAVFEFDPINPENPAKNYWDASSGTVIIDNFTSGSLSGAISAATGGDYSNVTMITVSGQMNSSDLGLAHNYCGCTLLDLSRVTGISEIPSHTFDFYELETLYLPSTIEKLCYRALAECPMLSSLTIYATTPPVLEDAVFLNVPKELIIYVPAAAISQYQNTDGWNDFTILPIQEDIRNVSVSLPEGVNMSDYAKMWLELTNTKSGQKMHYVLTGRTTYTFANIIRNTSWNAVLRNERGDVFAKIDNIEVKDEDVSVSFASVIKPQNIGLSVVMPDGTDVTTKTQVIWMDAKGNYMAQTASLTGLLPGNAVRYKVVLLQELAMQYVASLQTDYVVGEENNEVHILLEPIKQVTISGCVKDSATKTALNGAMVTVSQTFGDKYSKTINTKTDSKGNYTLTVCNVPTSLAVSASDYISQTIVCDSLMTGNESVNLSDISLKGISGAVITLGLTYTKCPSDDGDEGTFQEWYADYNNIAYSIYNKTKLKSVNQFNVQYPQIVLLEEVEEGDVLEITATSKVNAFMPVKTNASIDAEQRADASFNIVELGKIQATFAKNGNASVVGSLYDGNGKLIKSYDYSNASLTINELVDGSYTLVTMGRSKLFNSIYDLSQLPQTGLVLGTDYTQTSVDVKSGQIATIGIDEIPTLDESKLYYTGNNTSFSVNKSSIVAGNYLTLTGHLDFKTAYAANVSNVNLIVDLPESCEFVKNSVMVGSSSSDYTLNGNRITIPMTRFTDRVRFCIIPTRGGDYAPSALVQFDMDGETITQPIGSANYTAKDLSISVPSTVAKSTIPVSGTANGTASIDIYDGDVLIGQTRSLANGTWSTTCELIEPYNLSTHNIYAKITTKDGVAFFSETKNCTYDMNAIEVKTVTMINTAHPAGNLSLCEYKTVFDFQNPSKELSPYWYWPSYPDFTFIVDFTNNDTTLVKDVTLYVFADNDKVVTLHPEYDAKKDKFTATAKFDSYSLPYNVSVDYDISRLMITDVSKSANAEAELIDDISQRAIEIGNNLQFEHIDNQDSLIAFKVTIPNSDTSGIYTIKTLDYQNALHLLYTKQFDFKESINGFQHLLVEQDTKGASLTLIDTGEKVAYLFSFNNNTHYSIRKKTTSEIFKDFMNPSENLKCIDDTFGNGNWLGTGATILGAVNDFLGLKKYLGIGV